ncbi:glycosyltransferase family 4 protein [Thiopseudomonas alkaliphila]|uniref:glycosyltransferase family 4 protein n=1 Tax=Thiopseudomonas alkaliphila TaxID=1697053 RepID=UPI00069DB005|nr:glycosyltransferase [Thiopseudomonas alkaliphila]AKX53999.1 hypothetical protein AKN91_10255 [Thiopseudomonas alkaliphila]
MKIVHIITGLNNGGAEGVLYRLCKRDKKHKHSVISLRDMGKYGPLLQSEGVEVYCLNMPQGRVTFSGLQQLYNLLKSTKPDVVQTWMYHADLIGGVIARLAGFKNIFWNIRNSVLEKGKSKRSTILISKLCSWISPFVPKHIICCANKALEVHAEKGYQRKKMVVIGNGYELDKFTPNPQLALDTRNELMLNENVALLGMVGRYDPLKDHANLLIALSQLKHQFDFKCLLVGKDLSAANRELIQIIEKQGLQSHVVLLEQRNDIPAIMNALDLHILSSSSEAFPNVIAEAMACGTPCVSTDVGDAALIVGEAGWVVSARDSRQLALAIAQALALKKDSSKWVALQSQARNRILENFGIETMISKYHNVWNS